MPIAKVTLQGWRESSRPQSTFNLNDKKPLAIPKRTASMSGGQFAALLDYDCESVDGDSVDGGSVDGGSVDGGRAVDGRKAGTVGGAGTGTDVVDGAGAVGGAGAIGSAGTGTGVVDGATDHETKPLVLPSKDSWVQLGKDTSLKMGGDLQESIIEPEPDYYLGHFPGATFEQKMQCAQDTEALNLAAGYKIWFFENTGHVFVFRYRDVGDLTSYEAKSYLNGRSEERV